MLLPTSTDAAIFKARAFYVTESARVVCCTSARTRPTEAGSRFSSKLE